MPQFFSNILKRKNALLFICLFIIGISFSVTPLKADAAVGAPCNSNANCATNEMCSTPPGALATFGANVKTCQLIGNATTAVGAGSTPSTSTSPTDNPLIIKLSLLSAGSCDNKWPDSYKWYDRAGSSSAAAIADIIPISTGAIFALTTSLATFVMSTVMTWPITNGSTTSGAAAAFMAGWISTRDLANMLIVLGFVIVGIATALRIREYEAKQFLWKLIIVALLVNFSGLLCGLIIDASNLTMTGLLKSATTTSAASSLPSTGGGSNMPDILYTSMTKLLLPTQCAAKSQGFFPYLGVDATFALIFLATALSFLYLIIVVICRYSVLGILFILSPLAFAFWGFPFPKAKDLWNKWWNNFLKWSFIGVGMAFFLNLANTILNSSQFSSILSANSDMFAITNYLFVVLAIIVVGVYISVKGSGVVGAAVMGIAGGATRLAGGAVGLAGRMANNLSGGKLAAPGEAIKRGYGKAMERIGVRSIGTTASANSRQVEEEAGSLSKAYTAAKATNDTATMQKIQRLAQNGRGYRAAAAMKVLADNKDLGSTFGDNDNGMLALSNRMRYAEAIGASGIREKAEKLDPRLRALNPMVMGKNNNNPVEAIGSGFSKASVTDIRDYSPETLRHPEFINRINAQTIERAAQEMPAEKIAMIKSHASTLQQKIWSEVGSGPLPTDPKRIKEAYDWAPDALRNKLKPDVQKLATINRL